MQKTPGSELYIGLMSGTSIDAMDGCLAAFKTDEPPQVLAGASRPWQQDEKALLHSLCQSGPDELERAGRAAVLLASAQTEIVQQLLCKTGLKKENITAIGSHGQTVRHCPGQGFSVQLNGAAALALKTGIDVVSDFRAADIALGGDGAPLTPAFHSGILGCKDEPRYVLNLGGIANLTVLAPGGEILSGFDTGPANTLIDTCCRELFDLPFDEDAALASQGALLPEILRPLVALPYFAQQPPKSTGRELFCRDLIAPFLDKCRCGEMRGCDLLYTLTCLTARSVCAALKAQMRDHRLTGGTLAVAGGGVRNPLLMQMLKEQCADLGVSVRPSADFGVDPQLLEAESFAYFAWLFAHQKPLRLGRSSRAQKSAVAGALNLGSGRIFSVLRAGQSPQDPCHRQAQ